MKEMHKKLLNQAWFKLRIKVEGPLLIKSGVEDWDPAIPDMQFIRTRRGNGKETVFIPGSSLKGALRSYTERIVRTLNVSCCDPFEDERANANQSCGTRLADLAKKSDSAGIYKQSCTACKIYGSTNLAGRAAFADSYPAADVRQYLTKRTAVAIDRVLGSVAAGPFDFEALMAGEFQTNVQLTNFELWQLGLVGLAVRDLCLGRIRIGYGKSRGFGEVTARLDTLELRSLAEGGVEARDGKIAVKGIGALLNDQERESYGIGSSETTPVVIDSKLNPEPDSIGSYLLFKHHAAPEGWSPGEAVALFTACVEHAWASYRNANQVRGQ
jgi:CRISPR-associated RAMP protein (TIGR02581 family)